MTVAIISMIRDPWGGSEELWYEMAKIALKEGHAVIHMRYENPDTHFKMQELISCGLIAYSRPGWIPPQTNKYQKLGYLTLNFLRKRIKNPFNQVFKHKPDVLLYNGTCYSIAKETRLLGKLDSNVNTRLFILGHLNNDLIRDISNQEAAIVRSAYKKSQKVFFVSERNYITAKRHLCTDIPNYQLLRNPANIESTDLIVFPSIEETINFAMVGNLITAHKGQDIVLQVLSSEKWEKRNWVLNIYGDGIDKCYLQNLCNYFGLQERVLFHGKVRDIRNIWKDNHALLMPSLMEGMPLAVVEAMLCGRICIVTDVGGNREWIDNAINGFIADAPTVYCMEQTLEKAWERRNEWNAIGEKAHQKALQLYEKNAAKKLLKELCQHG